MASSVRPIHAFREKDWDTFEFQRKSEIKKELNNAERDYILNVDKDSYNKYLYKKYLLFSLILSNEERVPLVPLAGRTGEFECFIEYTFEGTAELFKVTPNPYNTSSYKIFLNEKESKVSFGFLQFGMDPKKYEKAKDDIYRMAFGNLDNINSNVKTWNENLSSFISKEFSSIKNKYLDENKFFEAINVKVDEKTSSVFVVPTIQKKIIPPTIDPKTKKYTSEPTIHKELYDDILKVIYDVGKKMERKPSLYIGKNEEDLRDLFLLFLETRYEEVTATGETFNRAGKTDILLKFVNDGSNLFVAECKFWGGVEAFSTGINQLFEKYLSWSDSKTALIIFVKEKGFTSILQKIKSEVEEHKFYVKEIGERTESSFSYIFHLPQDKDKQVYFEVMAFHFDK